MRAWVWVVAASCALAADPSLDRAKALSEEGKAEEAVALYAEVLSRAEIDPLTRAIARYERAHLLERDLGRAEEALGEYRRFLAESRNEIPRTTRVVRERIEELENELGSDGELWKEIAAAEDGTSGRGAQEEADRLGELLYHFPRSAAAREGYLALARVCQDPTMADWRRSLSALDAAERHGAPKEETQGLRENARIQWRRVRLFCGSVALLAFVLCATLCLTPWRATARVRRIAWLLVPLGALLFALAAGGVLCHVFDCFKAVGL